MPRRRFEVRLYSDGAFQRFIAPDDAEVGLLDGSYEPVFEQRGREVRQIGVQLRKTETSGSDATPCHISAEESRINALGQSFRRRGQPLLPGEVERFGQAEAKIRWWPKTRDRKATPRVISDVAGPFCTLPLYASR